MLDNNDTRVERARLCRGSDPQSEGHLRQRVTKARASECQLLHNVCVCVRMRSGVGVLVTSRTSAVLLSACMRKGSAESQSQES